MVYHINIRKFRNFVHMYVYACQVVDDAGCDRVYQKTRTGP